MKVILVFDQGVEMSSLDVKYKFLLFPYLTIYDYKCIEDNLAAMAVNGWRTERIGSFLWKFKRSEPSNKKFSVLFTSSVSEYESVSTERQELLEELCDKGGWKKEYQWKQMQIFYADQGVISLETDEAIKLENIHQNMKKTFIPNWTKVLFLMLILAFFNGTKYFGSSLYSNENTVWALLITLYGAFIAGATLLGYMFWLKVSKKKISEGGTCVSVVWYHKLLTVLVIGFVATFIGSIIETKIQIGKGLIFYTISYIIAIVATVSVVNLFSQFLKKKKFSYRINVILYSIVTIILIIVAIVIMNVIGAIIKK